MLGNIKLSWQGPRAASWTTASDTLRSDADAAMPPECDLRVLASMSTASYISE